MLTAEGQRLAYKTWKADLHIYAGIADRQEDRRVPQARGEFKEVTIDWWLKHPEIDSEKRELIKMLTTKK